MQKDCLTLLNLIFFSKKLEIIKTCRLMYIHQKSKQKWSFKKINNLFLNAVFSLHTVALTRNDLFSHHRACLTPVPLIPLLAWLNFQEKTPGKTWTLYAHRNSLWATLSQEFMRVYSVVHYNAIISRVETTEYYTPTFTPPFFHLTMCHKDTRTDIQR